MVVNLLSRYWEMDRMPCSPGYEIDFSKLPRDVAPIYSFEAKWILDTRENQLDIFSCPADIPLIWKSKL
jgi:D-alanine-D-alanine ligase